MSQTNHAFGGLITACKVSNDKLAGYRVHDRARLELCADGSSIEIDFLVESDFSVGDAMRMFFLHAHPGKRLRVSVEVIE